MGRGKLLFWEGCRHGGLLKLINYTLKVHLKWTPTPKSAEYGSAIFSNTVIVHRLCCTMSGYLQIPKIIP